uniref:Ionotropic glutamate receptor L-glutamate and glycine-binding domain-containing protein n=1 Tax=Lutzomyia longipalpis TaxID=7200 RepID=A0A3F2ZDA7_LUTLO
MRVTNLLFLYLTSWGLCKGSKENTFNKFNLHDGLDTLTTSILSKLDPKVCFAILTDRQYYDILRESIFRSGTESYPVYLVLVSDSDDLLSPNYRTVRMLQEMRRVDCGVYVIYLANGIQMERFFRFGDKYRLLSSHAKYVLLHDYRLFTKNMQKIWKKIINVIFVRQFHPQKRHITSNTTWSWFELTTVPFPTPLKEIFVPKRVDFWQDGHFLRRSRLFEDKTHNLDGQVLRAALLEHVPAITKNFKNENDTNSGATFGGVEVEMIKALSQALNFRIEFYESPQPEIEKWGRYQYNGSFSGLLGEIVSSRTDFALGDFHYTRYHLVLMDLSIPYDTECLTFLTPEILADNSWKTLILPFSSEMWIGVCISLLLVGSIFFILSTSYIYIHDKLITKSSPKKTFCINNLNLQTNAEKNSHLKDGTKDVSTKYEVCFRGKRRQEII